MKRTDCSSSIPARKFEGNPLCIPTYEGLGAVHPSVLYFPRGYDGYKFWLYYTPFPPESAENPCLVRSNDGKHFSDAGVENPLITPEPGSFESNHLMDPDATYAHDRFLMLYSGQGSDRISRIGLAESYDGKHFSKSEKNPILYPTQPWELGQSLECPTALFDGEEFHVLYEAKGPRGVGYALGKSLERLVKYDQNPVLEKGHKTFAQMLGQVFPLSLLFRIKAPMKGTWDAEAVNHLKLFEVNDQYYLFYVGRDNQWSHEPTMALGLAESKDLRCWRKWVSNPAMLPSTGWESLHIYRASPIVVGNLIYLYYSAFSRENIPQIGLALIDLKSFLELL